MKEREKRKKKNEINFRSSADAMERDGQMAISRNHDFSFIFAEWINRTVGRKTTKATPSIHKHTSVSQELWSERVSEWANEWVQRSEASRAERSEQTSERCERTSEFESEWPSSQRVDFTVILPNVDQDHRGSFEEWRKGKGTDSWPRQLREQCSSTRRGEGENGSLTEGTSGASIW